MLPCSSSVADNTTPGQCCGRQRIPLTAAPHPHQLRTSRPHLDMVDPTYLGRKQTRGGVISHLIVIFETP
jgi:hypothetical protein